MNRTGHESPNQSIAIKEKEKRLGVVALLIEVNIAKIKMTND